MRPVLGLLIAGGLLGLLSPPVACGQSSYDLFGSARASGLGYASTALTSSVGVHSNPAVGALYQRRLASFYVRESFGLAALRYGAVYGAWPVRWGTLSVGGSTMGNETYREAQFSAGYARGLQLGTSRTIFVGLRTRYYHTHIERYGSAGAVGLHLGLLVQLLPSLHFGAQATNLNAPSLVDGEPLPQSLSVGLQYRVRRRLRVVAEVFKDWAFPASVRAGVEVHPLPILALRAGVTSAPTRFTGGVGIRLGRVRAQVAAEQHSELGWSPSVSLEVRW